MLFPASSRRVSAAAFAAPLFLVLLVACGQGDSGEGSSAAATSASASPSVSASVSASASASPTAEEAEAEPEPTPEETEAPYIANLELSEEEIAAMYSSAEELAAMDQAHEQDLIAKGYDPNDEYIKYGEVLCGGQAFATTEDLRSWDASQAFIDWYARYVAEAPQHVHDMSAGNRAAEEQGTPLPAIDSAKCSEYGLLD